MFDVSMCTYLVSDMHSGPCFFGLQQQKEQRGSIGLAFDVIWYEPMTNKTEDIEAAERAQDFQLGW